MKKTCAERFTSEELVRALQAYIETVGNEQGVDFIKYIEDSRMQEIVKAVDSESTRDGKVTREVTVYNGNSILVTLDNETIAIFSPEKISAYESTNECIIVSIDKQTFTNCQKLVRDEHSIVTLKVPYGAMVYCHE